MHKTLSQLISLSALLTGFVPLKRGGLLPLPGLASEALARLVSEAHEHAAERAARGQPRQ